MTDPFVYRKATPEQSATIERYMGLFSDLHEGLLELPPSRERSLSITKLEEAAMWANKAIAFHPTPDEPHHD